MVVGVVVVLVAAKGLPFTVEEVIASALVADVAEEVVGLAEVQGAVGDVAGKRGQSSVSESTSGNGRQGRGGTAW